MNLKLRANLLKLGFSIGVLVLVLSAHRTMQKDVIYRNTLGVISKNWENDNGNRYLDSKPYKKITNENFIHWDGSHYYNISRWCYNISKSGQIQDFAFFPLFPCIWRMLNLEPSSILWFNYLLFLIGIFILFQLSATKNKIFFFLAFLFPGLISYLIPYTEAVFIVFCSIGFWGFLRKKYLLYFLGFLFAAMTRPASSIILASFIAVEFLMFIESRNIYNFLSRISSRVAPIILGTLLVMLLQFYRGSDSFFMFFNLQETFWGKSLSFPTQVSDWSHEGFGMNIAVIFMMFIPLLIHFFSKIIPSYLHKYSKNSQEETNRQEYLVLLSMFYLIGSVFYVFLFQHGSLNGLFRYTISTPFFYYLLFSNSLNKSVTSIKIPLRFVFGMGLFLVGFIALSWMPYSKGINFSDLGFFVASFSFLLYLFSDFSNRPVYKIIFIGTLLLNVIWMTYLLNTYVSDGWIYT